MDPHQGGFIDGPKNLALSLVAFELSWVDGGSATCSLASNLALAPIHEKGTQEQRDYYMNRAVPPQPGEDREIWRGAFALTEPLPYVGVDTGVLVGKVRVDEWKDGEEPMLHVEKRGRFITNMDFAHFVTAAVDSTDERIKGSCMITLQADDPGSFDRGAPHPEDVSSAFLHPRPPSSRSRSRPAASSAATKSRTASLSPISAIPRSSARSSTARASLWV